MKTVNWLIILAGIVMILWLASILLTTPLDGGQLAFAVGFGLVMGWAFGLVRRDKSRVANGEAGEIIEGRVRKYQSTQEALNVAIDYGEKEAARRRKAGL